MKALNRERNRTASGLVRPRCGRPARPTAGRQRAADNGAGGDANLLFNVGPMPTGEIEPRQVARLKEMGAWLAQYGESVYGTCRKWNDKAPATPPNMDCYTAYMKGQLKELLTGYGPIGILWFDGEWEGPWTHERGVDLYNYVRSLQPNIIINNRVGKGRAGMDGMDKSKGVGDYGTPEQEIPATGFGPGVDWESCMTMNGHWGYNKNDQSWKSAKELIQNLINCASKGGNYLLNVGPSSEGLIPAPSLERLDEGQRQGRLWHDREPV